MKLGDHAEMAVRATVSRWALTPEQCDRAVEIEQERGLTASREYQRRCVVGCRPCRVSTDMGLLLRDNLLVNGGGLIIWQALRGDSITEYDGTNSYLAVGDDSTAAAATQTALVNEIGRQNMETGWPYVAGETNGDGDAIPNRAMEWRTIFGTTEANGEWREFGVFNASSGGTMLDRFVSNQGEKAPPNQVWQLDITITAS